MIRGLEFPISQPCWRHCEQLKMLEFRVGCMGWEAAVQASWFGAHSGVKDRFRLKSVDKLEDYCNCLSKASPRKACQQLWIERKSGLPVKTTDPKRVRSIQG